MKQLWAPWRMPYLRSQHEPSSGCVFCLKQNLADEEAHILYRGETCYIALNRYPYANGHLLIIPYAHVNSVQYLDDATCLEMGHLVKLSERILMETQRPQGFNIGINEGMAAGAGIAEHLHLHIVPRWLGDVNYLTVIGETRVIPEMLDDTYAQLRPLFEQAHEEQARGSE
ncbi:MAG TPA: HIT domain-containing protein [Chloroflexi bacterium]|nr:HIT domain-containing protein [Chloroflexota bacterium]